MALTRIDSLLLAAAQHPTRHMTRQNSSSALNRTREPLFIVLDIAFWAHHDRKFACRSLAGSLPLCESTLYSPAGEPHRKSRTRGPPRTSTPPAWIFK